MEIRDNVEPNDESKRLAQYVSEQGFDVEIIHENNILVYKKDTKRKTSDLRDEIDVYIEEIGLTPCHWPITSEVRNNPNQVHTERDIEGRGMCIRQVETLSLEDTTLQRDFLSKETG